MPSFSARDGTELSFHVSGEGAPVICVPGGPMQDSVYLGDLGGLTARRRLVLLDLRATGRSAVPEDDSSYRCDRLVDDVEALREHLGLDRIDLLAHSAGANVAARCVERNPRHVRAGATRRREGIGPRRTNRPTGRPLPSSVPRVPSTPRPLAPHPPRSNNLCWWSPGRSI